MTKNCMRKYFTPSFGLLILRVAIGAIFIYHGYQKFSNIGATVGFFGMLGLPSFVAYLIATIELLGGIALVLGVGACIFSPLLALTMVFAILLVKRKMGFGAMEIDLMLLVGNIAILSLGVGKYSIKCPCPCGVCNNGECCGKGTCGGCGSCNGCETCVCDASGGKVCECTPCKTNNCGCSGKSGGCSCGCGSCGK